MIKTKDLFIFTLAIILPALLTAQQNHFIYLQTEGKQPFYAKLDKKVLSSSASGYLIIPKLKDGQYNIIIGFPKAENSEQAFACSIDNKDAGYLIKNFGEKGWGLFNMQTLDVVMAGEKTGKSDIAKTEKTDDFSNMLSEVVNDPSIKQTAPPKEKSAIIKGEDMPAVQQPDSHQENKSIIIKKQLIRSKAGVQATYIDISGDKQDTIEIFIPVDIIVVNDDVAPTTEIKKDKEQAPVQEKENATAKKEAKIEGIKEDINTKEETKSGQKKEITEEDKKFLPIKMKAAPTTDTVAESSVTVQMVNSDCKTYASDEDFLKLRKKMAAEDTDDAMIAIAQKFFKAKCYTTDQVKNLSALFLKDAGKYRFFDLAYQFVSDSSSFSTLESQLSDAYYISRFKAMVRH
jgi:hypothetical protein